MKKIFLVMLLSGFGLTAINAQNKPMSQPNKPTTTMQEKKKTTTVTVEVPDVVKTKFSSEYASAKDVKWEKAGNNNYAAVYHENGKAIHVVYTPAGEFVRTKKQIDASALPGGANDYIKTNYAGQPIKSAWENKEANGTVTYVVKVGDNHVTFDDKGNYVAPKVKVEGKKMEHKEMKENKTEAPKK